MKECESCNRACPWIPTNNNYSKKCPLWIEKQVEKRILKMVKLSGRTIERCPRFEDMEYSKNKIEQEVKKISRIHTNPNHLFFIFSNPGTGKTHCLLSYCFHLLSMGVDAYYVTAARLRTVWLEYERRHEMVDFDSSEMMLIQESAVLMIDDFAREGYSQTGHFQKNLEGILTSTGKKIILASNQNKTDEQFPYKNEGWIMDRLNHAYDIAWFGVSYREPDCRQKDL